MNVKQIVIAHLKAIGADGLCAEECGCGLDDFMPCCGDGIDYCVPAKKVAGDGISFSKDEVCYRPMETPTEVVAIPKKLIVDLVYLWNKKSSRPYGSPNHCHYVPGIWDSDNGELANKPCAECAIYDEARKIVADLLTEEEETHL